MAMKIDCSVVRKVTMIITLEDFTFCFEDGFLTLLHFRDSWKRVDERGHSTPKGAKIKLILWIILFYFIYLQT
jgi:hypothetical protein